MGLTLYERVLLELVKEAIEATASRHADDRILGLVPHLDETEWLHKALATLEEGPPLKTTGEKQ